MTEQLLAFLAQTHQKVSHHFPPRKVAPVKSAVVVFPGLNRDQDMIAALTKIGGTPPALVWHKDSELPDVDLIVIPGGFSYGDYLRAGAIAARSPIMTTIRERAQKGVRVLGVCNGFQILTEAGLLPGVLMRNASLRFVCREVRLKVENADTDFTRGYSAGQVFTTPVAHHDGNYFADPATLKAIEDNGQVAFRYAEGTNPNGSLNDIAGVFNADKTVLGLMPHPENLIESAHGGTDGRALFSGLLQVA
jgi:phosphoribosylformylglycinamidine synthase